MLGGAGWIVCSLEQSLELILGPDGVEVNPKFEPDKLGYDPPPLPLVLVKVELAGILFPPGAIF